MRWQDWIWRAVLVGSVAVVAGQSMAQATERLTIIGHAVHQRVLTEGPGGNILEEWAAANDVEIEWVTLGVPEIHERLYRELTLAEGEFDVAFLLHRLLRPSVFGQLRALDPMQAEAPIDDFEGLAAGMREGFTYQGELFGIPYRHATDGLHYNKELFAEKGIEAPPRTLEEMVELAETLTYTRDDGTQVHGLILDGVGASNVVNLARAWNGDFITSDFQIEVAGEGMVEAVTLVDELYGKGVLPKATPTFTTEDVITFMQQGRAAMAISPFGRYRQFNDPEKSKFPGAFDVTTVPASEAIGGASAVAAAKTDIWALTIPANGANPELAWSFVRHVSSPEATTAAAINGNGPVRASAYDDPRVQELVPYWQAEAAVVQVARPALPGFEQAAKAQDMFVEEVQAVLLGAKEPQAAMDDLAARLAPLMP